MAATPPPTTGPAEDDAELLPETMYGWRVRAMQDWCNENAPLSMEKMLGAKLLDQFHYRGIEANDDIIRNLADSDDANCNLEGKAYLDVGSGIGGTLRYVPWKTRCKVLGVEIQSELVTESNRLAGVLAADFADGAASCETVTVDLTDASAMEAACPMGSFDGWFSLLVILHVPKAPRFDMFRNIFRSMKAGARFSIEDYVIMSEGTALTPKELEVLDTVVGAHWIPTRAEYEEQMRRACLESRGEGEGPKMEIKAVEFRDMTPIWREYTLARKNGFLAERDEHVRLHGETRTQLMEDFYVCVADLFQGGRLGGAQIVGEIGEV